MSTAREDGLAPITMTLDAQPVLDALDGYRKSLSALGPEASLQILDAFFDALDSGIVEIAVSTDPLTVVAGEQIIRARCSFVGADEFFATAVRAAQSGSADFNGHEGSSVSGRGSGCGDFDSTGESQNPRPTSSEPIPD